MQIAGSARSVSMFVTSSQIVKRIRLRWCNSVVSFYKSDKFGPALTQTSSVVLGCIFMLTGPGSRLIVKMVPPSW